MTLPPPVRSLLLWAARIPAIAIFAILATAGLLPFDNWPDTHEDLRYQFLTALFAQTQAEGFWYPRWLPEMAGGYGYPTFVFYQPGFFFAASAWMQLGGSPSAATYWTVIMFLCIGGIGALVTAREMTDEWAAWFSVALFLLTPYLYVNLLVRGDLSELCAMLLVPWLLFFAWRIVRGIEQSQRVSLDALGLGLVMAGIAYCHPMVALLASGMLAIVATSLAIEQVPLRPLLMAIGQACLVTAALSVFYTLPLVQMSRYVDYGQAISGYYTPSDHAVDPLQYFQTDWGFGGSKPGIEDAMSFQLGLPHAALAIAGLVAARRERFFRALFAGYLLLVIVATNWFGWVWDAVFPLRVVQFPWRILAVTAVLQAALAAGIHRWLPKEPHYKLAAYLFLTAITVYWSLPQFTPSPERNYRVDAWVRERQDKLLSEAITFTGTDEFRPRTAAALRDKPPRGSRPIMEARGNRQITPTADSTPHRISYHIEAGPPAEVVINQAYFPGWRVELDAKAIPPDVLEKNLTPDGRISVPVADQKQQLLVAWYAGPPGGLLRSILCVALLGAFVGSAVAEWRWRRPPPRVDNVAPREVPLETPREPDRRRGRKRRK